MPPDAAVPPAGDLPGARAAILGRLWGAIAREPIPGLTSREAVGPVLVVKLPDGRTLRGEAAHAQPFARPPAGFALDIDATSYDDPVALLRALGLPVDTARLEAELANSVTNLALARTVPAAEPRDDVDIEQSIVDGHPLHPGCRTRMGLSTEEVLAYAPEHRPVVTLTEVEVPADRWYGVNLAPRLLVHPWQRDHVLDRYPGLTPTGRVVRARPLMSLRTLSLVDDPTHHVKTAVDVQMTSAVRTVSPAAIHNGPVVSALLSRLAPAELAIAREFAAGAVLVDGEPCRSLAIVHRRMPALAPGERALPLAAAPTVALTKGFFDELVRLMLPPLLRLLDVGVGLEAHGQNLLVVVRDGRPVRLIYRDMGGLRISPTLLETQEPRGDIASDDPVERRTKVFASAVSTVLAELVSALERDHGVDARESWAVVVRVARGHGGENAAALVRDPLPIKAMTAMRLAADPLTDVWTELPNPMVGL